MAKTTGLGVTTLSVDDSGGTVRDIRNDITSFNFATPRGVQDVTGIDKSAMERLLLLADFSITLNGVVNNVNTGATSHAVLRTVSSTSVNRTVTLTLAGQTLATECLFTDYQIARAASGDLNWTAPGVLSNGTAPAWS